MDSYGIRDMKMYSSVSADEVQEMGLLSTRWPASSLECLLLMAVSISSLLNSGSGHVQKA